MRFTLKTLLIATPIVGLLVAVMVTYVQSYLNDATVRPRYDGVYQCNLAFDESDVVTGPATDTDLQPRGYHYVRFYTDGNVIAVHTDAASPTQIEAWFNRKNRTISRGRFRINDGKIEFASRYEKIVVDYYGDVNDDGMKLDFLAHETNMTGTREYRFIPD